MKASIDPLQNTRSLIEWLADNRGALILGGLVAAAIVALMLILRMVGEKIAERHPNCVNWKGIIGAVLAKTGIIFMVAAALEIVASYAAIPSQIDRAVNIIFIIAFAIQMAVWVRELVMGSLRHRVGDEPGETTLGNAMSIVRVLVSVTAFALAAIFILDNLGVNVTTLVAGLGIGGIAIGLAAQGIFSDLFAALSIVFDRPFRRGDTIRFGDTTGTVEQIGLKTTRVRAQGGEQVIMSNKNLLDLQIHNLASARARRTWLTFAIVHHTPPEKLALMPNIAEDSVKAVSSCRMVRCCIKALGASGIEYELVYDDRSIDFDTLAKHRSDICLGLVTLFAKNGIDLAYPTQTTFTAAPDGTMVMPYATPAAATAAAVKKRKTKA
ncbi:MAG: mechanosensitive ion channel [Sphingomonas sp.]|nr:mechanosensitive ion channel [Sphingomonas sp.]